MHVGRLFISEDPAGFVDGPNLYAYVGGNPIMAVDPSGLSKAELGLVKAANGSLTYGGQQVVSAAVPNPRVLVLAAAASLKVAGNKVKSLFGRPHPTKKGANGQQQP